jgi:hypothetical protein
MVWASIDTDRTGYIKSSQYMTLWKVPTWFYKEKERSTNQLGYRDWMVSLKFVFLIQSSRTRLW